MHAEEAGLIELELAGRERMRKDAEEHARAEDSGAVAAAQMAQQIASVETRLDALKQRLYFPPIKGFRLVLAAALTWWAINACSIDSGQVRGQCSRQFMLTWESRTQVTLQSTAQ